MSDIIVNAGAASPDAASVATPSDQPVSADTRIANAIAAIGGPKPAAAAAPAAEPQPTMAELIRSQREARQAAQQETQRRGSVEAELKAAREELAKAKEREAFEDDPVGYAKSKGWTKEQQLLYGQSLLYDLAPDKADPDFRIKMFEDRQNREKKAQERAAREAEESAATEAQKRQVMDFYQDTATAVKGFESGSYPESEAWFGEDVESYMQSMMATAKNLAARATREGRVADLSASALASALEAETARRLAARDERKQKRTPAQPATVAAPVAPSGMQAADTMSTRNMSGAGTPQAPATSDRERIQRAISVAFRSR
jgi:hypothetical protein